MNFENPPDKIFAVSFMYKFSPLASLFWTRAKPRVRYNQIIYDEPERDNCIIIYQNSKISKKIFLKAVTKSSNHKKHIQVTASFSTKKPEMDFLTLRNYNKV